MNEEASLWMSKAESDLRHARNALEDRDYEWSQLASQQAAEKALKAVCIAKGIGLIRTHDLTILARKLKAPKGIIEKSALLNPFYTSSRYPDEMNVMDEELNRTAAHDAISAAEEVVSWSRKQLRT